MPTDHAHRKTQTWILVMLFWVLSVSLFVAGYMLYGKQEEQMSADELAQACADAITNQTSEPIDELPACESPENGKVSATSTHPGFTYPEGWHVFGSARFQGDSHITTAYVTPEPVFLCADCDMPILGVQIRSGDKDGIVAKGTFSTHTDAYVASYQDTSAGWHENVTVTRTAKTNGRLTIIKGDDTENSFGGPGAFEIYVFEGTTNMSVVAFTDRDEDGEDTDGAAEWPTIRDSLDFSKIE